MDPWRPLDVVDGTVSSGAAPDASDGEQPEVRAAGRPLLCLSDIHGDLAALESVLHETEHLDLCGVVAAGDHCLGGPDPFGVWQRLCELGAQYQMQNLVRGPSDIALGMLRVRGMSARNAREEARLVTFLRTQQALGDLVCRRLGELPSTIVVSLDDKSGVMVMHGAPADEYRGLSDDEHLAHEVGCVAEDVLVTGCTHRGFVRRVDRLLVVNAGSVGMSPVLAGHERTAHAVLIVPCDDGVVRAFPRDVPLDPAVIERVRRAG